MASTAIPARPDAADPGGPDASSGIAGLRRSDFEFVLPPELIAQHPAQQREAARLLHVHAQNLADERIADLGTKFQAGDVLVLNDTKVIPARLHGAKSSGGRVEVLLERALSRHRALVLLRTSHTPRPGLRLRFFPAGRERSGADDSAARAGSRGAGLGATVRGRQEDLFELEFDEPVDEVLAQAGEVPLPPYIQHRPAADDAARYQTVYARTPGAVAAPTAGLHLSERLLGQLQAQGVHTAYVTLHVGAGTFQPVRAERLSEHRMHAERYAVPASTAELVNEARARGRSVIAVGTTSVRALESNMQRGRLQAGSGETRLFILPGYTFQCVDRLLTNFHLPGSTLLMLVSAFAGTQHVRRAYQHAIAQRYRFFSYGDAMLLERTPAGNAPGRSRS
jgi:S-adenosylmethionine:tRNA ribosyltransferase-isomerase